MLHFYTVAYLLIALLLIALLQYDRYIYEVMVIYEQIQRFNELALSIT